MELKFSGIFFLFSILLFSQTRGVVVDMNGDPIEDVIVFIVDQDIITYTNEYGEFFFSNSSPINSFFEFQKFGYSTKSHKYLGGEMTISLEMNHIELDEVGIVESNKALGNSQALSIESKRIENNFYYSIRL